MTSENPKSSTKSAAAFSKIHILTVLIYGTKKIRTQNGNFSFFWQWYTALGAEWRFTTEDMSILWSRLFFSEENKKKRLFRSFWLPLDCFYLRKFRSAICYRRESCPGQEELRKNAANQTQVQVLEFFGPTSSQIILKNKGCIPFLIILIN